MKRILLVGRVGSGKTTLCQFLNNEALKYYKTQTINVVANRLIDTPGEYLELRGFRGALSVTANQADVVGFVQDATENGTMFPPLFCGMFAAPVIGIITKTDLVERKQLERARQYLHMAGASSVFETSSYLGKGFNDLGDFLGYDRRGGTDG